MRKQFYDPFVQEPSAPTDMSQGNPDPVHGFRVENPGLYLLLDDVVSTLRLWAAENNNDVLLVEAAESFASMNTDVRVVPPLDEPPPVDLYPEVARVELFPDQDGKWYARPVSADGSILAVTQGSFDRGFVERDAVERWPGKEVFEIQDAMGDSIWDEQVHSSTFNGRARPSPRRLWS